MSGNLILVSGLSGAGKTTLIRAVLEVLPKLTYLHTATTRPPRSGEADGIEYQFVDDEEYETLRQTSKHWDHAEYHGYKYGADVAKVLETIQSGNSVICALAPNLAIIAQMKRLYGSEPITIWIDTSAQMSATRIAGDTKRAARQEDSSLKSEFMHIFTPSGELVTDQAAFIELLQSLPD